MRRLNKKYRRILAQIKKAKGGKIFNDYHRLCMEIAKETEKEETKKWLLETENQ